MAEKLKDIEVSNVFTGVRYQVPIYQRNYAWGLEQIQQLIEDIDQSKEDYFLGNLIVNHKSPDAFEVIDGQQRLTTLYLLGRYLGMTFSKTALSFEAREKANATLEALPTIDQLDEKFHSTEIIAGYKIIEDYFEGSGLNDRKEEFCQKLDKVKLIRVQVPENIDLNHYFEVMNTRGEQLELHEIIKAKLLSQLSTTEDKLIATDIWDACSNMDSYVQMNYTAEKRRQIFSDAWSELSTEVTDFDSLKSFYQDNGVTEEKRTLLSILKGDLKLEFEDKGQDEVENERFESIISFPNFLLQVNEAMSDLAGEEDATLDDRNFLENLNRHLENENTAKQFLYTLLKSRVYFDKFILKREYARDYKELGKWSLQNLEKYKDNRGEKPRYKGTFGDEGERNQQIRTLQSALRITYTSPKSMHWISKVLSAYLKDENCDLLEILEDYAQSKVDESGYQTAQGFGFERIVFSYLDYLLYRDGYSFHRQQIIKPLSNDWQFQFRSSIEHFYPQNPSDTDRWDEGDLNCFGNLALITVSGNSKFSNAVPNGKVSTNPSIIKQSLKLMIMASMMETNNHHWTQDLAQTHQKEMFELLANNINREKLKIGVEE